MKTRWIFWLLVVIFVWIVVSRFTEAKKLAETLTQGQWQWVLAAAVVQVIYFVFYTGLYQSAFDCVDVRSRLSELAPVTFVSIFLNVAAPSGGASGAALFVDDAARRGESAGRTAVGTLLVLVADFSAFLLVLAVGMVYLFAQHDLKSYEIVGAVILLVLIAGLTGLLLLGLWKAELLRRLLDWVQQLTHRLAGLLKRPDFLDADWAEKNANEFIEAAMAIAAHPGRLARTFLIALCAHLIDLTSLYCLFLAFHEPAGLGVLVAGYAMGVLFWIVSITPQGIGVVEGVMALVFTSLGVPAARATIISLAFRGLAFWLPLLIGFVLLRRMKAFQTGKRISTEVLGVRVVALATGFMGLINMLSAVTPSLRDRLLILERYSPLGVIGAGHLATALAGFALILLSTTLWRRKQVAWMLTEIVLVISFFTHIYKGLDYEEAILSAVLAGWLLYLRPHFHARSDPPSIRQGIATLFAAFTFTLVYGAVGFYLLDRHFQVHFGLGAALRQTIQMFTEFTDPGLQPTTRFGRYFIDSIYTIGAATMLFALVMLVRPVLSRGGASPQERERARQIVTSWGHSSLAALTLLEDKLYFFSPGGTVIAYVVQGRTALALGDPIGPPEDFNECLEAFAHFCARNDWQPAYYQVLPDHIQTYSLLGFSVLPIGQEGIVNLETFTLAGGENKGLRSAFNRLNRLGYQAKVHHPPHSSDFLNDLHGISDEWLTTVHGSEKKFSLGWFSIAYLNTSPIMCVMNPQGQVLAFTNILSEYQANEVTIDLMRHRSSGEHGIMDFMFVSLLQWAKEQGYATFNLGLSGLAGIGETSADPAIERALHYIYAHINQFYNFQGLHEFKDKFHPAWSPRYLVYPNSASLPAVVIAMIQADSGINFFSSFFG